MLKVEKVHKKYSGEDYAAVIDLSFQLDDCEILTIVGRSGSGKSTLLRMIAGLMKPDAGSISFNGVLLENPDEQLIAGHEKIKMVFQDFQVKPNMTVAENIKYKLLHFNKEFQDERTEELLELCGLLNFADKKPHELSGGQKQRLSLARALADDPELLLMDEPFSNLDPIIKEDLLIELTQIVRKEGIGLILVSHDTHDAMLISDRIAYIEDGELIQIGSPEVVYKQPSNFSIAHFFGRINNISDMVKTPNSFVRAEDIIIGESDFNFEVRIVNCRFLGKRYLIQALVNNSTPVMFYSSSEIEAKKLVDIGFQNSSVLQFS